MTANISRRAFLGTAGAAATTVAVAAPALADAPAGEIAWDEEADLVVIGYGVAGMAAAHAASAAGASVIVLEKSPEERAGGATRVNGGTFGLLSRETFLSCSFGAITDEIYDAMLEGDAAFMEWIVGEAGVGVVNDMFLDGFGKALWEAGHAWLSADENVTLHFEARAVKLVKNAEGVVVGAIDEAGRSYGGRNGVVVCTGSYIGNKNLVWGAHFPYLPYEICTSPDNTGDAIYMIADAGGAVMRDTSLAIEFFGWAMEPASREVGTALCMEDMNWRQNDFTHARVFVNKQGKRFMAEDIANTHDRTTYPITEWIGLPGNSYNGGVGNGWRNLPMWAVMDSKTVDQGSMLISVDWQPVHTFKMAEWSADNQAEVEKGWILKADTLEELAALMQSTDPVTGEPVAVDAEEFLATVDEYNAICEAGVDPLGKDAAYLTGLDTPPYYAIELVPCFGYTNSGITTNINSQVLTWSDEVVPGLYAAGDVGQGMRGIQATMRGCAARATLAAWHALGV